LTQVKDATFTAAYDDPIMQAKEPGMKRTRKIIEIDEEKCTGCGQCILACAEGALRLVDGKAKLVGEILCDGIGACIGECPEGALTIVEREAEEFSEAAVTHHASKEGTETPVPHGPSVLACGCPSSAIMAFAPERSRGQKDHGPRAKVTSELGHWPVKLQLLGPQAAFLKGSDMLLMADCCAVASPDLHETLLKGRTVALACPKLDDAEKHISRLAEILTHATPRTLTVVHMEVPCCTGLVHAALEAVRRAGVNIPVRHVVLGRRGEIIREEPLGGEGKPSLVLEHQNR